MSRSLRTLSVLKRPSNFSRPLTRAKHSLLRHDGETKIQHVRFKSDLQRRAKMLFYQIAIASAVADVGYHLWQYLHVEEGETVAKVENLSKTQLQDSNKANEGTQEDDKVDEDDVQVPETMPEDAWFIPLGRPRQLPHTHYKESDSEWQSFVEFAEDGERKVAAKKELIDIVCSHYASAKSIRELLGVPITSGRIWLDIVYPMGPPPEYERSGVEITEDYVAWTTRPISALQVARLDSALRPLSVAKSLWASYSIYCSLQLARLKQFLNITPTSSDPSRQLPVGAITVDQLVEKSSKQETQTRAQMDKMSDLKSEVGSTKSSAKSASSHGPTIYGALPSLPQPDSDIKPAVMAFKRTLAKHWEPPHVFGERGNLAVRGEIEVRGPKGRCVIEVVAYYHPREARYTALASGLKYYLSSGVRPRPPPEPRKSSS